MRPQTNSIFIENDPAPPVPMGLLRSALFSVSILPEKKQQVLPLLNDFPVRIDGGVLGASLKYSGPRLSQRHSLVWQALICAATAIGVKDNARFLVPAAQLLSLIGSETDDQHQRERLWRSLTDLTKAHIAYSSKRVDYAGALVASVARDKSRQSKEEVATGWLSISLNIDLIAYLSNEVLFNDLKRKSKLSKNYLACWLHDYIASHQAPPPKSVEAIRMECGSTTKQLPAFRYRLKEAMGRLTGGNDALVKSWSIDGQDRLVVERKAITVVKLLPLAKSELNEAHKNGSWQNKAAAAARLQRSNLCM